jgi:hypothetical protein
MEFLFLVNSLGVGSSRQEAQWPTTMPHLTGSKWKTSIRGTGHTSIRVLDRERRY